MIIVILKGWKDIVENEPIIKGIKYNVKKRLSKYFSTMCTREDVEFSKPDPALYLLAASRLDVTCDKVIAIEDSPNGVKAAQSAGIRCVAVPNPVTKNMDISHADIVINSLAEINLHRLFGLLGTAC